jgi:hypothetical protein
MLQVQEGQCGLCAHFAEGHAGSLVMRIRSSHEANEDAIEDCGHPKHAPLHLKVTAVSKCDGFQPAEDTNR